MFELQHNILFPIHEIIKFLKCGCFDFWPAVCFALPVQSHDSMLHDVIDRSLQSKCSGSLAWWTLTKYWNVNLFNESRLILCLQWHHMRTM